MLGELLDDPSLKERLEDPESSTSALRRMFESADLDDVELMKRAEAEAKGFDAEYRAAVAEREQDDVQRAAEEEYRGQPAGEPSSGASAESIGIDSQSPPSDPSPSTDREASSARPGDWILKDHQGVTDPEGFKAFEQSYQDWLSAETKTEDTSRVVSCASPANVGSRRAPTSPTRAGTVLTPKTNTMATRGTSGEWQTVGGELRTRVSPTTGREEFKLEAHVYADPNFLVGFPRARITVSTAARRPDGTIIPPVVYDSGAGAPARVLCYADDAGASGATRAYVDGWLPLPVGEPGFQVRVEILSTGVVLPINYFWGADQVTIGVGPKPSSFFEPIPDAVGVVADTSLLVDRNGKPDDLETIFRPFALGKIKDKLAAARGRRPIDIKRKDRNDITVLMVDLYTLHLETDPTIDLEIERIPGSDNEAKLTAKVWIPDLLVRGSWRPTILPIFPPGVSCYGRAHVSAGMTISAIINLDQGGGPLAMTPKTTTSFDHFNIWGMYASPWPWPCNLWYLAGLDAFGPLLSEVAGQAIDDAAKGVILRDILGDPSRLVRSVEVGSGGPGLVVNGAGAVIEHTCETHHNPQNPGQNTFPGHVPCHGGRVALTPAGLEVAADVPIGDKKRLFLGAPFFSPMMPRRFPWTYVSSTPEFRPLVADHKDANGQSFSLGALVTLGTINAAIRALVEGSAGPDPAHPSLAPNGLLDRGGFSIPLLNWGVRTAPTVSPVVVDIPRSAGGKMVNVFVPDLRLYVNDGSGAGNEIEFGVNFAAGADVTVNSNGQLVPSFAAAASIDILNCHSIIDAICKVFTYLNPAINWAIQTIVVPLLNNSVGTITLPSTLIEGTALANPRVQRRGTTLAVYADVVVAPKLTIVPSSDVTDYRFDALVDGLPGTGPITYQWRIDDVIQNAVDYMGTNTTGFVSFPLATLQRRQVGRAFIRVARATVTASRAGASVTSSGLMTAFRLS